MEQFGYNIKPFTTTDNWQNWQKIFELMILANGINNEERKKALLLFCGGEELRDIFYAHEEQYVPALQHIPAPAGRGAGRGAAPENAPPPPVPEQASPCALALEILNNYET
jgi:hypothetical protein